MHRFLQLTVFGKLNKVLLKLRVKGGYSGPVCTENFLYESQYLI